MVWETIFSRAWKSESESWSGGYKQFGELFVPEPRNPKARTVRGCSKGPGDLLKLEKKADASQLTLVRVWE